MEILNEIKQAIISIEPEAEVYLFGSRARGTHKDDSDWDVLVLLPGKVNYLRKEKIWNALYNLQYFNGIALSIAVKEKDFWDNNQIYHHTEFYKNLTKEMAAL
ncbi:MAG: nucleotidyltransferase domain-containing protein [bacterium]